MAYANSGQSVVLGPSLPFLSVNNTEFAHIRSGPRVYDHPPSYYGPVTIRNYIAGYTQKHLRLSGAKRSENQCRVFFWLPIELRLHVLEHLHPIDLYHFSQVSKSFRKLILDPKSAGVWKTSFERHPDIPRSPPRVLDSDWAFMIYGPGICGACEKYGALTDFAFLKRYCEACMKENYAFINAFKDNTGHTISLDHEIWTLLPRSHRYNGIRYTTSYSNMSNAKYLRRDFYPMWKKIQLIHILVDKGVPHLSELYEEYKTSLAAFILKLHESTTEANSWAMVVYRQCADEYDALYSKLTERCKTRLQNLGHETVDIEAVSYSIQMAIRQEGVRCLTPKTFRKIRPRIEGLVKSRKESRIKGERQFLLEGIYRDYLKTLTPEKWQYLPQPRYAKEVGAFEDFLKAPCDRRGDLIPGQAVAFFPEFIDQWTRKQLQETIDIFPEVSGVEDSFEAKVQRLELVTSVVTCSDCKYKCHLGHALIGRKDICRHRRSIVPGYVDPCATYEVNHNAVASAASLVSCVGLDPSTTTVSDMNARNDRFVCGNCLPEPYRGFRCLKIYTWHECIQHTMEMTINNDLMHVTPAWFLLTREATRFVREHEYLPKHYTWCCNHCAHHFEKQVRQADAIEHAKKVHCIEKPVVGVDYIMDLRTHVRRRRPFRISVDPAFEYRCELCPDIPIYKLWPKDLLIDHIRSMHQIAEPSENRDWTRISLIAAAAATVPLTTENTETTALP